jgi:heme-degrading monooxygenase HmoA
MFAVVFEVTPKPDQWEAYLGYAKLLRPELEKIEGFIDNTRFASRRRPGALLSLSTWRNEKALIRWRTHALHHGVQEKGRFEVFSDYRLRVGEVASDSRLPAGVSLPSERLDETERGASKLVAITERKLDAPPTETDAAGIAKHFGFSVADGPVDWDVFEDINRTGEFVLLTSWLDAAAAKACPLKSGVDARHRIIRVIRDYGMSDRAEAPQYYPPVPTSDARKHQTTRRSP